MMFTPFSACPPRAISGRKPLLYLLYTLCIGFALAVFCAIPSFAQVNQAGTNQNTAGQDTSINQQITFVKNVSDRLDAAFQSGEFVGLAVAVVDGGELVLLRTYGETHKNSGEAVGPNTVFRLASVSKTFASTLLGVMVEQDIVDWDDTAHAYAPDFRLRTNTATNAITLEYLASHRVGLPPRAYDNLLEAGFEFDDLLDEIARLRPVTTPGKVFAYQNIAFSVIGDVVAGVDGVSFAASLETRLFKPLNMHTASAGLDALMASESWARPHSRRTRVQGWRYFTPNEDYYRVEPAGGLNASVLDMAKWVRAQLGHEPEVLSQATLTRLHTPLVDTPDQMQQLRWMRPRLDDADYALGWRVLDYDGERVVMHAGGVAGYRALVVLAPEHDMGFTVMWNSATPHGWRIMPMILDEYFNMGPRDWLGVSAIVAQRRAAEERNAQQGEP